ncbi:hypothetical protein FRX31_027559 [Thalictrum thalictroides]|uniref:Uncharacterized protein n=1 Tax=Thalictrum thalictroides TaxID=46969 RepID=A0A7J6VCL7_THATH|nr:hypothetical protein FRX31_027559 [Thalictrum thalictroides]
MDSIRIGLAIATWWSSSSVVPVGLNLDHVARLIRPKTIKWVPLMFQPNQAIFSFYSIIWVPL